ncbi:MAG TPA: cobalamin-binding protein [Nitrospiria bacterium]|nr:cobalamin-binding protein [Nitrospiria bacterium]
MTVAAPYRIVCLTAETAEILYALSAGDRVVGISGHTTWPPEARGKPKVGGYTTVRLDRVLALKPDLVLAYSDLQADAARDLIRRGVTVITLNQRSLVEILQAVQMIGAIIGKPADALRLVAMMEAAFGQVRASAKAISRRPRVYFEEWDDPLISGIRWVGELIDLAGGEDIFAERREARSASDRVVRSDEVIQRDPEIIVASWCGRKVRPERIARRPGWETITAVKRGRIHEIKSAHILQPGLSILNGLKRLHKIFSDVTANG